VVLETHSPQQTEAVGRRLGAALRRGDVVALDGPLGAGKTVLARAIAEGCGATGYMASPSFVVIREYAGAVPVYHVDLYRLERLEEIQQLGLEELMDGAGIVVIEWAERAAPILPAMSVRVHVSFGATEHDRHLVIETSPALASRLAALIEEHGGSAGGG
jgi:tRNA threonylcarbamoyladenosine biosynthesis protein TsaE